MDADTTPTPTPRRRGRLVAAALGRSPRSPSRSRRAERSRAATTRPARSSAKPAQRDGHRGDCPEDKDRGGDSSGTSFDSSTEL